jgi:hypothetical protein
MRIFTASLLAATLTGLSGLPAAAHADGYVSLGVGSEAALGGELGDQFHSEGLSAGRLALGYRSRNLAIEAVAFGNGLGPMSMSSPSAASADMATASLGIDLKYHLELVLGLEGYGRAGLHKTWLAQSGQPSSMTSGYQGDGHVLGGGLQYGLEILPVVDAAVWMDYSHQVFELADADYRPLTGTADVLTFGLSLGL